MHETHSSGAAPSAWHRGEPLRSQLQALNACQSEGLTPHVNTSL